MQVKPMLVAEVETDALEAILAVKQELHGVLVGRSVEIEALLLAVISGQHLMLEGETGVAKTMLAEEFALRVDPTGFVFFKTQLNKGMVSDQLLGPMRIKELRENEVYCFNTQGMLPQAHIAVLDEVYRGPEMLLPIIFSVLNERKFHNGNTVDPCPLITAIGTTNFRIESEELRAFHDRWIVNAVVSRLGNSESRIEMLTRSLTDGAKPKAFITMGQIRELMSKRKEVVVPNVVMQLYEAIVAELIREKDLRSVPSDRRIVFALRLAQAATVLRGDTTMKVDDLAATEYGLVTKGVDKEMQVFSRIFTREVGTYQTLLREERELGEMAGLEQKWKKVYDEGLSKERKLKLQRALREAITQYSNKSYTIRANQERMNRLFNELEGLLKQVTAELT